MTNCNRSTSIAALLASYPEDVPISRRAKLAAIDLRRYHASSWRFEAELPSLPDTASNRRRLQHAVLMHNVGHPLAWRQLLRLATMSVENSNISAEPALNDKAPDGLFTQRIGEDRDRSHFAEFRREAVSGMDEYGDWPMNMGFVNVQFLVPYQVGSRIFGGGEIARLPLDVASGLIGQRIVSFVDIPATEGPQPMQRSYEPHAASALRHRAIGVPEFSDREMK
jgi:hypothetical protein